MIKVLDGVRVLDLGSFITAPLAAMLLGELGADVVKVERPDGGDPFRSFKGVLYSPHFQSHNRNKRSVALDYTSPEGREVLDALIMHADVLLINVRPGVEKKLGLEEERLRRLNPRLIYCSITGFGDTGPYSKRPAYDNVGQTASGWLSLFHSGADPRIAGPAVSDALTGTYASIGILGALHERSRTGVGRRVEVNMLEATIAFANEPLGGMFANGVAPAYYERAALSQSFILTCADGRRVGVHLSSPEKFWNGLVRATGRPDLAAGFPSREERVRRYEELCGELSKIFACRNREEWETLLTNEDVPFAPERTLEELPEDPQIRHLKVFYETHHPKFGKLRAANRPIRYDGDNDSNYLPPPALGEHSADVLQEAGITQEQILQLFSKGVLHSSAE